MRGFENFGNFKHIFSTWERFADLTTLHEIEQRFILYNYTDILNDNIKQHTTTQQTYWGTI